VTAMQTEIWELQPPGTFRTCPGMYRNCFFLFIYFFKALCTGYPEIKDAKSCAGNGVL